MFLRRGSASFGLGLSGGLVVAGPDPCAHRVRHDVGVSPAPEDLLSWLVHYLPGGEEDHPLWTATQLFSECGPARIEPNHET